jgi:diguanylate cyclase (GGDEF)-like protein
MLNSDGPSAVAPALLQRPGAVVVDLARARVRFDGAARQPSDGSDVAMVDWDVLFNAVTARLQQVVGSARPPELPPSSDPDQVRAQVLQCVVALEQLHSTMSHFIERGRALDRDLSSTRGALTQARAELSRTQAGERAARHLAAHDGLTLLPNGSGFRERLAAAVGEAAAREQSFAVLYIDLDGFKAINDAHGHAIGDELLRVIAARLRVAVRAEDMVSRLGGDEFACLLWIAPPHRKALERLARSLSEIIAAPFQIGALTLTVRPSIGIALWPGDGDGDSGERLIAHADAAMYRAKRQQSGHAFFDEGLDRSSLTRA